MSVAALIWLGEIKECAKARIIAIENKANVARKMSRRYLGSDCD